MLLCNIEGVIHPMKRILALAMTLIMSVLLLTGCGAPAAQDTLGYGGAAGKIRQRSGDQHHQHRESAADGRL